MVKAKKVLTRLSRKEFRAMLLREVEQYDKCISAFYVDISHKQVAFIKELRKKHKRAHAKENSQMQLHSLLDLVNTTVNNTRSVKSPPTEADRIELETAENNALAFNLCLPEMENRVVVAQKESNRAYQNYYDAFRFKKPEAHTLWETYVLKNHEYGEQVYLLSLYRRTIRDNEERRQWALRVLHV